MQFGEDFCGLLGLGEVQHFVIAYYFCAWLCENRLHDVQKEFGFVLPRVRHLSGNVGESASGGQGAAALCNPIMIINGGAARGRGPCSLYWVAGGTLTRRFLAGAASVPKGALPQLEYRVITTSVSVQTRAWNALAAWNRG